ncbi:EscU/YscU/HrcU family type III secretion system export apparatus switch protein [Botrimarina hoheduenensis]|uniref:Flagellar biosynthetic protein FlhB n=1 Tax=Botrimarina hoheduenensis TaxID=2528000 RepID=A0A5C5VX49_9BACT|nr:EscU/YscU/HrcU family type III secretion system export apparatus switch protein [Botrimarina hoheduenensis]TWT43198.1 Flagellar biosynthetic protein FlhB [Botrimarina hoheduenensis]
MAEAAGEKSFDATPYRRQQAREKGQVPYSQDLGSAVLLLAAAGLLKMLGGRLAAALASLTERLLAEPLQLAADRDLLIATSNQTLLLIGGPLASLLGLLLLAAAATNLAQTGLLFVPDKLAPDISRLNPIAGLGRIFSIQGTARLGFGLVKVVIVAAVSIAAIWPHGAVIAEAGRLGIGQLATLLIDTTFTTVFWVGGALLVLALADLALQRWKHEQDLKMTSQEMKEEMKNLQGDPEVAARRKQVQRQLAMSRMGQDVPKADVVVTNPTELAIALRYDAEVMAAPVVVAKGAGVIAQRIRRLALENGVPIVERKPLARLLYKEVAIGHPVTADSYAAVAEVLAYVYRLKGKKPPKPPRAA